MTTTSFRPKYSPVRTITMQHLGRVDVYEVKGLRDDGSGAQATFIRNNAKPNRKRHYGIKLFRTKSEALAAYQRQKIAADAGLAPPVRRMVKFVVERGLGRKNDLCNCTECRAARRGGHETLWGYQTCLAYGIGTMSLEIDWCDFGERPSPMLAPAGNVRRLYAALLALSTKGTQRDHAALGETRKRNIMMAHDLHCENMGFWRKRPVVIDFGAHIVNEGR